MKTTTILSGLPSSVTAGNTSTLTARGAVALPTRVSETLDVLPPSVTVAEVISKLQPAVFLSWRRGSKGDNRRWGHLKLADMTPEYMATLPAGNVGVVFGRKSADVNGAVLAGIDLDRADFVEAFLAANPRLAGTWMSRGRPDRLLVIVRVRGPYPRGAKLVHATETAMGKDGKAQPVPLGEWRVDGSQSIVPPSIHPETQQPYEVVSFNAPVLVEYNEIVWPPMVGNPPVLNNMDNVIPLPSIPPRTKTQTQNTLLSTESLKEVPGTCPPRLPPESVSGNCTSPDIQELVRPFVVHARGHSNQALLRLAARLKCLQTNGVTVDTREVFQAWWTQSKAHVDSKWAADWFYSKLLTALESSTGGNLSDVLERAKVANAPGTEVLFDDRLKLLATVCYLLQRVGGGQEFYLSCGKVVEVFAGVIPGMTRMDAWRWLRALEGAQLIKVLAKGKRSASGNGTATRYQYIVGE